MLVSDGKQTIRINVSDAASWAQRGFIVKEAGETKPPADDGDKPAGKRKTCPA